MKRIAGFLLLILIFATQVTFAKSLVLVHGSLSSVNIWGGSGISYVLQQNDWSDQGIVYLRYDGTAVLDKNPQGKDADLMFYRVLLPAEAPIELQSDYLSKSLDLISTLQTDQELIIVAHSTGGVVSRMSLVNGADKNNITQLITIASPHLGTPRAADALNITQIPFPMSEMAGIAADMSGIPEYRSLQRSSYLLYELLNHKGSLLNWLNNQEHPEIKYTSIIRAYDDVVPGFSQDMNNVPALKGKSEHFITPGDHSLYPADGMMILKLLDDKEKAVEVETETKSKTGTAKEIADKK